jgi:F-type H+-transporting ATPase subunit a
MPMAPEPEHPATPDQGHPTAQHGAGHHDPSQHVMEHVKDSNEIVIFTTLTKEPWVIPLYVGPKDHPYFQVSKFMVLELLAACIILAIFLPLARRAKNGDLPTGLWWNTFESLLTFVRDNIAKPALGHEEEHATATTHAEEGPSPEGAGATLDPHHGHAHDHGHAAGHGHGDHGEDYDVYVPYLWTVFLFVLTCNLLGMIPFLGSPTASLGGVTLPLAMVSFIVIHGAATMKLGLGKYLANQWPKIEIEIPVVGKPMALLIGGLIFVIEMFGTVIKCGVLSIRLFANMFAGHLVLGFILLFILTAADLNQGPTLLWGGVTLASVLGSIALSLLELFVAFLHAFIFTFLTALFMGMAQHSH